MNMLQKFLNKALDVPFWVKLVMYKKLSKELSGINNIEIVENFLNYVPTLTFKGDTELEDKKYGLDGNTYNFLNYIKEGYSLSEISINTFLSLEEVAKSLIFCQNQGFIDTAEDDIQKTVEYISGKSDIDMPDIIKKLKIEAQKRIILDYKELPQTANNDESEISRLKCENRKLHEKLGRLHEVVQNAIRK